MALGVVLGLALTHSLRTDGIEQIAVPAGRIAVFLPSAGVVSVLALLWLAFRAGRLDVLRTVTTE